MNVEILTIGEAARVLGIAVETARIWADDGRLPAFRTARGMRLCRREDVEQLAERCAIGRATEVMA